MPFKDFTVGEVLSSADVDLYLMSQVIIRCTSGTRPSSPAQGWHIYETDTQRFLVYNGTTWIPQGSQIKGVIKTAAESVTSSTTLQADDELVLAVDANTNYSISGYLYYISQVDAGTTADIKVGLDSPAGSSLRATFAGPPTTATTVFNTVSSDWAVSTGSVTLGGVGFSIAIPFFGSLRVAGTAGNLQLMWAQAVSNGSPARVLADSHISITRLS